MKVLLTGGAGFIGSHSCIEFLNADYELVVVDNLMNSSAESLKRVEEITSKSVSFYEVDILDRKALEDVFEKENIEAVIHYAGLKAVGESVAKPLFYYSNNITGTLVLLETMKKFNVNKMVFSSSATVYGLTETVPLLESFPTGATNPYGRTKLMIEKILQDVAVADEQFHVAILRYFNPVGAHPSGKIGEDPIGIPNNLLPYISQVAVGKREQLSVFGDDYPTPDGTGVRDYIHVVDLSIGHVKALKKLDEGPGVRIYNLGTGRGYSVLEVIEAFKKASGKEIPYQIVERRPGDVATSYADPTFAKEELGWEASLDIDDMCRDGWKWQSNNPNGYH